MGKLATDTKDIIARVFREHGPLFIADAQRLTGLHPARIQRHVGEPEYRRVDCEWASRRWAWRWAIVTERCDCGQPAWYRGQAWMLYSKPKLESWLLCRRCAALADASMEVTPLYG